MIDIRTLDDEDLEVVHRASLAVGAEIEDWQTQVQREVARRAEIRVSRIYFGAEYGFAASNVVGSHDASWYESRQTEEQFLQEMGVDEDPHAYEMVR